MEEREIIQRAAKGNLEAFEELVRMKREKVFWISYHITGNEEDARDISQLVFIRLWKILRRFQVEKRFDTWLYRITVNMSIDYLRASRERTEMIPLDRFEEHRAPSATRLFQQEESIALEEIQKIYTVLSRRLAPKQRAVFALREIEGLSTKEISKIMRINHSTVRNHLFQARQIMQDGLKRYYPEYLIE